MAEVEVAAGRLFLTVGLDAVAGDDADVDTLRAQVADGRVWVAEVGGADTAGGELVAYAAAEVVDGNAHVAQVSVDPRFAGHRIGRRLVLRVEEWGRDRGLPATTLTTFTDVPWNAPYYARLGYAVLPDDERGPELVATMAEEATWPGVSDAPRCAMVKHQPATLLRTTAVPGVDRLVAGAVVHDRDRVLVVRRSADESFLPGIEELPSGGCEPGETLQDALVRELAEEIGWSGAVEVDAGFVAAFDYRTRSGRRARQITVAVPYAGHVVRLSEEHSDWRWLGRGELAASDLTAKSRGVLEQWWAYADCS
jgi:8-oxo-dGTP pyrophosphatase MutT (NUDIX family)/GNAT superfamily N-acetyltransferase